MNMKRYFLIVGAIILVFACIGGGVFLAQFLASPYGEGNVSLEPGTLDQKTEKRFNVLVLGTDYDKTRTDVMALCQVDTENKSVKVLSIPRDTRVKIGSHFQKINAAYALGKEAQAIKTVKALTSLQVHHFVVVDFEAFRDVIDALGGVDFDVPQRMKYTDPYQDLYIDLQKGPQHLDGDKSEQLVRFRRYPMGDLDRVQVQQDFFHALADQKLSAKYILKIPQIYGIVEDNIKTDMSAGFLLNSARALLGIPAENINTYVLPGTSKNISGVSYYVCDAEEMARMEQDVFLESDAKPNPSDSDKE